MSKKDEKKLDSLTNRTVRLIDKIYKAQQQLTKLETEADKLLRKLLRRNGKGKEQLKSPFGRE